MRQIGLFPPTCKPAKKLFCNDPLALPGPSKIKSNTNQDRLNGIVLNNVAKLNQAASATIEMEDSTPDSSEDEDFKEVGYDEIVLSDTSSSPKQKKSQFCDQVKETESDQHIKTHQRIKKGEILHIISLTK